MNKNKMSLTSIPDLLIAAVSLALIAGFATFFFYGSFFPIRPIASVGVWIMAICAALMGWVIRKKIERGEIGQDSSQMNPVFVMWMVLLGKTMAWVGASVAGVYGGISVVIYVNFRTLFVAEGDLQGSVLFLLAGVFSCIAGLWLERSGLVPPSSTDRDNDSYNVVLDT